MVCGAMAWPVKRSMRLQSLHVLVGREGNCDTRGAGTASTADAVDVVFGELGQVEVDHVADAGHVECRALPRRWRPGRECRRGAVWSGCGYVRPGSCRRAGLQQRWPCANRSSASMSASRLVEVNTMACLRSMSVSRCCSRRLLCAMSSTIVQTLLDVFVACLLRGDLDALGIFQQARGQLADVAFQRGGEEQGLAAGRGGGGDFFHVVDEAHVQHAVGFVQNQHFQTREIDAATVEVVDQAARRGNQDVHRLRQQLVLQRVGHAAEDADGVDAQVLAVFARGVVDLVCQFAGRGQYQYARAVAFDYGRRGQAVQGGQHEGGGFAGAGLCRGHQVVTGEDFGNGFGLDRGGFGVAAVDDGLENGGMQIQIFKRHGISLILSSRSDTFPFRLNSENQRAGKTQKNSAQAGNGETCRKFRSKHLQNTARRN